MTRDALALFPSPTPGEDRLLAVRNEALAALTLADFGSLREWEGFPDGTTVVACDPAFEYYARGNDRGDVTVCAMEGDQPVAVIKGFGATVFQLHFSPDGRYLAAGYSGGLLS